MRGALRHHIRAAHVDAEKRGSSNCERYHHASNLQMERAEATLNQLRQQPPGEYQGVRVHL